eukprot:IDg6671t1
MSRVVAVFLPFLSPRDSSSPISLSFESPMGFAAWFSLLGVRNASLFPGVACLEGAVVSVRGGGATLVISSSDDASRARVALLQIISKIRSGCLAPQVERHPGIVRSAPRAHTIPLSLSSLIFVFSFHCPVGPTAPSAQRNLQAPRTLTETIFGLCSNPALLNYHTLQKA